MSRAPPIKATIERGASRFPPYRVSVEVSGIIFGVPGSLERYSRAIRAHRHIPALHHIEHVRRGQVTLSRTSPVTTNPAPQRGPNTTASAARKSGPTCVEAVAVVAVCQSFSACNLLQSLDRLRLSLRLIRRRGTSHAFVKK